MNLEDARELLPWYAADALEPEERAELEALLAQHESLREELAQLEVLENAVQDTAGEPQWNPALIHDTLARIDAYEAEKAAPGPAARVVAWLRENLLEGWGGVPTLAKAALAAQLALFVALGGAWVAQQGEGPGEHVTAGGTGTAHLSVRFQPGVDQATVTKTLRELDAAIVEGPSSLGLYGIQVEGLDPEDEAALERSLAEVRARGDVFLFAQPNQ